LSVALRSAVALRGKPREQSVSSARLFFALTTLPPALAQEIHFSLEERLDAIDAALIATAKHSIDLASYALTDPIVLDALNDAERRGVVIQGLVHPLPEDPFRPTVQRTGRNGTAQ
jgi:phosphatidylserine/phosphatidylglycerophosphate/cardiolipin synthase-like enzyme